jgi:hypothetical protein
MCRIVLQILSWLSTRLVMQEKFYDKLVQENIYVRYWERPGISNKLRITVGTKEQNEKLLAAIKKILNIGYEVKGKGKYLVVKGDGEVGSGVWEKKLGLLK